MLNSDLSIFSPIDINGINSANPFITEWIASLESIGCRLDLGRFRLAYPTKQWDIIHFHWPEYILDVNTPESISWLEQRLTALSIRSKLVITVHNDLPHQRQTNTQDSKLNKELYKMVYSHMDGFIHMADQSRLNLESQFGTETSDKLHCIIPHGNYAVFGPKVEKSAARETLGLGREKIVLVIGFLRHQSELDLLLNTSSYWTSSEQKLLFCAKIGFNKPKFELPFAMTNRLLTKLRFKFNTRKIQRMENWVVRPGPVAHDMVSTFLSAADVVLIPRETVLNSGNLPLGFTYGCVVVGPNIGNVGELLHRHGNPTFNVPTTPKILGKAINEGLELAESGLGEKNTGVANSQWSWDAIAQQHRKFYMRLLSLGA